jgi:hypothetical protein
MRIQDDDCDVEMLEECDFEDDVCDPRWGNNTKEVAPYFIEMTKLAVIRMNLLFSTAELTPLIYKIVGNILKTGFPLRKSNTVDSTRIELMEKLLLWESQIPVEMKVDRVCPGTEIQFWSSMLHIAFK